MTDKLTMLVLLGSALSCSAAVLFWHYVALPALKAFHRALTEQLHRHRADSDSAIFGDVPNVPADFKTVFHSNRITDGSQPNHGAR